MIFCEIVSKIHHSFKIAKGRHWKECHGHLMFSSVQLSSIQITYSASFRFSWLFLTGQSIGFVGFFAHETIEQRWFACIGRTQNCHCQLGFLVSIGKRRKWFGWDLMYVVGFVVAVVFVHEAHKKRVVMYSSTVMVGMYRGSKHWNLRTWPFGYRMEKL